MTRRRTLVAKALAVPEKGEPQRRTAMVAWGLLATTAVYAGTMGISQTTHERVQSKGKGPAKTEPDVIPESNVHVHEGDMYRHDPADGYVPTYFDGRGGIAGVPLTEEQRQAVLKEALRRGVSTEDAHALAYGEGDDAPPIAKPNIKPPTFDGTTALAAGPLYREVAPGEKIPSDKSDAAEGAASPGAARGTTRSSGRRGDEGEDEGDSAKPEKQPSVKETLKRSVETVLPDPIEKPAVELMGRLNPFRKWMAAISAPGTQPTFTVSEPQDGVVTVTAESQMTDSMAVTVEVQAPVEETPDASPCTVSVTVTNPETGATVAANEQTVEGGQADIPRVAIGEVVEAVVAAAADDGATRTDAKAADEVVEDAGKALEELPQPEPPQPSATGEGEPGRPERTAG